jgi:hypothetical protein
VSSWSVPKVLKLPNFVYFPTIFGAKVTKILGVSRRKPQHAHGPISVAGLVLYHFFVWLFKLSTNILKRTRQKGGPG